MHDLIVIGGGPAALAATFYALGKQLDVVMVYEELGGKIGWPQSLAKAGQHTFLPGNELAHLLTIRTTTQAGRTIDDHVLSVAVNGRNFDVRTEQHGVLRSRTVLVATGADPIQLAVPGMDRMIEGSLDYSITTYAHLTPGQRVAVIGGTNRALSGAAEVADTAAVVYLVAPDPASITTPLGWALRQHPRVEVLDGWEVTHVDSQNEMTTLTITRQAQNRVLSVDRVFVALGVVPHSGIVRELVETDNNGFILVNAFHETSVPGLFAAGDVCSMFSEQVLVAIGDGARAAMTAYDYLLAQRLVPDA